MTDTPRTQAELISIFADNNSGQITPQDMRDFVVSLTNPVAGGGLDGVGAGGANVEVVLATVVGSPLTVVNDSIIWVPFNVVQDDVAGVVVAGSFAAEAGWGQATVPANSAIELPLGVYLWTAMATWGTNPGSGVSILYPDFTDNPSTTGDTFYGDPTYGQSFGQTWRVPFTDLPASFPTHSTSGYLRVGPDSPPRWALEVMTSGVSPNIQLLNAVLHIVKVA